MSCDNFDADILISSVKDRPCLWDKADGDYKHKIKTNNLKDEISQLGSILLKMANNFGSYNTIQNLYRTCNDCFDDVYKNYEIELKEERDKNKDLVTRLSEKEKQVEHLLKVNREASSIMRSQYLQLNFQRRQLKNHEQANTDAKMMLIRAERKTGNTIRENEKLQVRLDALTKKLRDVERNESEFGGNESDGDYVNFEKILLMEDYLKHSILGSGDFARKGKDASSLSGQNFVKEPKGIHTDLYDDDESYLSKDNFVKERDNTCTEVCDGGSYLSGQNSVRDTLFLTEVNCAKERKGTSHTEKYDGESHRYVKRRKGIHTIVNGEAPPYLCEKNFDRKMKNPLHISVEDIEESKITYPELYSAAASCLSDQNCLRIIKDMSLLSGDHVKELKGKDMSLISGDHVKELKDTDTELDKEAKYLSEQKSARMKQQPTQNETTKSDAFEDNRITEMKEAQNATLGLMNTSDDSSSSDDVHPPHEEDLRLLSEAEILDILNENSEAYGDSGKDMVIDILKDLVTRQCQERKTLLDQKESWECSRVCSACSENLNDQDKKSRESVIHKKECDDERNLIKHDSKKEEKERFDDEPIPKCSAAKDEGEKKPERKRKKRKMKDGASMPATKSRYLECFQKQGENKLKNTVRLVGCTALRSPYDCGQQQKGQVKAKSTTSGLGKSSHCNKSMVSSLKSKKKVPGTSLKTSSKKCKSDVGSSIRKLVKHSNHKKNNKLLVRKTKLGNSNKKISESNGKSSQQRKTVSGNINKKNKSKK